MQWACGQEDKFVGYSGIWFFHPCTSPIMLLMDLMKHVALVYWLGEEQLIYFAGCLLLFWSLHCAHFSFFHLPVISGSSLYCHRHFGESESFFCFLGWSVRACVILGPYERDGFALFRILIC